MDVRSLGYRTDLMLLELGGSVVTDHRAHLVVRTLDNPGFWWGNFVLFDGPPPAGDTERWTKVFEAEFPDAGHRAFGIDGVEGESASADQLERLGVTAEVNTVMTAGTLVPSSSLPALPTGTHVRPLAGDDDWAQALELDVACYEEPDASEEERSFMIRRSAALRALCEAGRGTWSGAFVDGRLRSAAGVVGTGTGLARYQNVETHPDFRRRGLASAVLLSAGERALRDASTHTLVIVADPEDDAIRLYRALGFTGTERQVRLHGTR